MGSKSLLGLPAFAPWPPGMLALAGSLAKEVSAPRL